jgi:hypothetical protein
LKPYIELVRKRFQANPDSNAMAETEKRWFDLIRQCQSVVVSYYQGHPSQRNRREASQELIKIAEEVSTVDVIETVLAMYLLADSDPRRFRSDEAFLYQVVRRVRALTEVNVGRWYDYKTQRNKRVYRDLTPKTTQQMGTMLISTLGVAGLCMARLEQATSASSKAAEADYYETLASLH